ncbi:uncharacterized protein G2W53_035069 [Senna tora]|uniref:Uncharacterized protein n=1 Tax=Senna tora TaxID=362788 RepID=A0A834W772_9FABA|nr:uncharacterized protein G2W53_035069 [Senna tora]
MSASLKHGALNLRRNWVSLMTRLLKAATRLKSIKAINESLKYKFWVNFLTAIGDAMKFRASIPLNYNIKYEHHGFHHGHRDVQQRYLVLCDSLILGPQLKVAPRAIKPKPIGLRPVKIPSKATGPFSRPPAMAST